MDYYIIIPAHNEEAFLERTVDSILGQSLRPRKVIIVNDHSTDSTETIIDHYSGKYSWIHKVNTTSSVLHLPGSKVINAFNAGLAVLDDQYDFLVKLDADLILPSNYFEKLAQIFRKHPKVGIAGGFFHEQDANGQWQLTHPMDKEHVRGAFKSYTKECFKAIGGLKNAMGWDTLDELLARYHGFDTYTDPDLMVKNLRPIGHAYDKEARYLQGIAMYRMGYGLMISAVASLKMAFLKKKPKVFFENLKGYLLARNKRMPLLVNEEEKRFIRKLRWQNIRSKLFQGG